MSAAPPSASTSETEGASVRRTALWDAALAERSPLFRPLAGAIALVAAAMERAAAAGADASFPQPETIHEALGGPAGVTFERQRPVSRRRREQRDPSRMYDARIAREGCVPTRPGSWHDLMNALVWATFPIAKRALHARQHGLVVPAAPGESARRSRELDALALLDEGGIVVVTSAPIADEDALARALAAGEATASVFGHAIYEGIVLGRPAPLASVVCVEGEPDRALAAVVADRTRLVEPSAMLRVRADERLIPA
ncbi:MAG: hypothetical protein JWP87_417 [Labilithrix sp.]|nr:hypothetical protein [Labilithrix sp.]